MLLRTASTVLFLDEPQLAFDVQQQLRGRNINLLNLVSENGPLEPIRHFNPDVVILGCDSTNGSAAARYERVRNLFPGRVPIILLYECTDAGSSVILQRLSDEALARPVATSLIIHKIAEHLDPSYVRRTRVPVDLGVSCTQSKKVLSGRATNISKGGIFIEADRKLKKGSKLDLSFILSDEETPMHLRGKVIHCRKLQCDQLFGMGVQFLNLGPEIHAKLSDFLESSLLLTHA